MSSTAAVLRRRLSSAAASAAAAMPGPARDRLQRPIRLVSSRSLQQVKPRILVVGSGWGGYSFLQHVDRDKYDVQMISAANHFLFTPLLPSCVTGTLEFRAIQEPVRTVPKLGAYYQAKAETVDFEQRIVTCSDVFTGENFRVEYDFLVLATGAKTNTFGIPGVAEREGKEVFFLKHLYHARLLRNRILECFERAAIHLTDAQERDRLLTFVVVGGGPTNCELVGELRDFINSDVARWYPDLVPFIKIHVVEMQDRLLGSFHHSVGDFVKRRFEKHGIELHLGNAVKAFEPGPADTVLMDGTRIPTGVMVWSAGLQQTRFVQENLPDVPKGPGNRIVVDERLRVADPRLDERVFAIGDCAVNLAEPLAPLAQAAAQQAKYLAKAFNAAPVGAGVVKPPELVMRGAKEPFKYFSLGSMVTFGNFQGAVDMTHLGRSENQVNLGFIYGVLSYFMWRSAYFLKQNSWTNRILIPMYWFKSLVLGRDISRF